MIRIEFSPLRLEDAKQIAYQLLCKEGVPVSVYEAPENYLVLDEAGFRHEPNLLVMVYDPERRASSRQPIKMPVSLLRVGKRFGDGGVIMHEDVNEARAVSLAMIPPDVEST